MPDRGRMIRILVVDDSPAARKGMLRFLVGCDGLELVGIAHDGQEGVELASLLHPDLVLMDKRMPVMNGLDATRQIKRQAGAPVVVMVSVDDGPDERAAAQDAGVDAFVAKWAIATELPKLLNGMAALGEGFRPVLYPDALACGPEPPTYPALI